MIASSVVAPVLRIASLTGKSPFAKWSAAPIWVCRPHNPAAAMFEGLPSLAPPAFFAARAAFVRSAIRRRSFSARAAYAAYN